MTKEQFFREIGKIDDCLILEADEIEFVKEERHDSGNNTLKFKPERFFIKFVGLAACLCLITAAAAVMIPQILKNQNSNNYKESPTDAQFETTAATESETSVEPKWSDKSITEQFPGVTFQGDEYSVKNELLGAEEIGDKAADLVVTGYDIYEEKQYTMNAELFYINGINGDCALAVKYEGTEEYYPCVNSGYVPETLGDLIDDLNLKENLVFHKVYYSYWKDGVAANGNYRTDAYTLPDSKIIWELLLSDTQVKNEGEAHYDVALMGIGIDVKQIGAVNISLAVNESGYLQTNILETAKSFYIGMDKVNEFVNYVKEFGTVETVFDGTEDEVGIPE